MEGGNCFKRNPKQRRDGEETDDEAARPGHRRDLKTGRAEARMCC